MGLFGDIAHFVSNPFSAVGLDPLSNVWDGITGQSAANANAANQASANQAMAFAQQSADKQMAFQERMSNTAYQRARTDAEAAGYNPIMAFMQGGASSPSGSSAAGIAAQNEDVGAAAARNISSLAGAASNLATLPSTLSQMSAQTKVSTAQAAQTEALTPAQVSNMKSQSNLNNANAALTQAQALETVERTKNYGPQNQKIAEEIKNLIKEGKLKDLTVEQQNRINEWIRANPHLFRTKQTLDSINPFSSFTK